MVINEAVELELSSRAAMDPMMSDLWELKSDIVEAWLEEVDERLRDAQVPCLVDILVILRATPLHALEAKGCAFHLER